ncbi:MAG: hypothetical protein QNJ63_23375 [Calothrix sp. MO_192.B10]|nr:hypothetical protein [Calothrix sp. MO_192.B10]
MGLEIPSMGKRGANHYFRSIWGDERSHLNYSGKIELLDVYSN